MQRGTDATRRRVGLQMHFHDSLPTKDADHEVDIGFAGSGFHRPRALMFQEGNPYGQVDTLHPWKFNDHYQSVAHLVFFLTILAFSL